MKNTILEIDKYDKNKMIIERKESILAIGGDGTLLKGINKYKSKKKPFFGFVGGTANFLMNTKKEISIGAKFKKFRLIKVTVEYEENTDDILPRTRYKTFQAFNDVAIGNFNAWIDFNCTHKENILGSFKGAGVIIATAQGSTGANINNHGTILPLNSNNWSVTGIQCNKRVNYIVKSKKLTIDMNSRDTIIAHIDGKNNIVHNVKSITVKKGEKVTVIFNDYQRFKEKRQH